MKKKSLTALMGAMMIMMSACGNSAVETTVPSDVDKVAEEAAEGVEAVEETVDEVTEDVVDKPDFTGSFTEPIAGRCNIDIERLEGDEYRVTVRWSGSAFESSNWEMTATYYESTGLLEYTDAKFYIRTYTDEENYTDDVKYTDGAGEFWFEEDGTLGWRSANMDVDGIDGETFFERVEYYPGLANPWHEVDDAQAAADGAGVGYFMVPENKEYNGNAFCITEYDYMEHIAQATGLVGSAELVIRKGLNQDSEDISGDYNDYKYNWSFTSADGFEINCFGNAEGKTIKAIWVSDNFSYSVNVFGQGDESETYGLSDETMKIIVELIQ